MPDDYRETALKLFGEQCLHCGSSDEVKIHHMDGDHDHDRRDNLVPLCQECHVHLHRGAPPYTVWLALGQPVIAALDELRETRGLRSRSEVIAHAVQEAGAADLSDDVWSMLTTYNRSMFRDHDQ